MTGKDQPLSDRIEIIAKLLDEQVRAHIDEMPEGMAFAYGYSIGALLNEVRKLREQNK